MTTELRETESVKLAGQTGPREERRTARGRSLEEVFSGMAVDVPPAMANTQVSGIFCDSRKVVAGAVFFALHGAREDGNQYVSDAIARGALAIVSEESPANQLGSTSWIRVPE